MDDFLMNFDGTSIITYFGREDAIRIPGGIEELC
jgi:hypothetical protein